MLPVFGWKSILDAERPGRTDNYKDMETQSVRIVSAEVATADAVSLEDEMVLAAQNLLQPGDHYQIAISDLVIDPRRHTAWSFTVEYNSTPAMVEIQLKTDTTPAVVASNSVWLALYAADGFNFGAGVFGPGTLLARFGYQEGGRIARLNWKIAYFTAETDVNLVAGTRYWMVICASDPTVAPANEWADIDLWVRTYHIGHWPWLVIFNTNSEPYPTVTSTYLGPFDDRPPWFRIYERIHTLEDVPLAPGVLSGSSGELATMVRASASHPQREIVHLIATETAGGLSSGGTTGGGGATIPAFTTGSVIFAGATGTLAEDNAHFFFDDANDRLQVGPLAPQYRFHASAEGTDGFAATIASDVSTNTPRVIFQRSRNTLAAPALIQANDMIGQILWQGYDGVAWQNAGQIRMRASENWGVANRGTFLEILMVTTGGIGQSSVLQIRNGQFRVQDGTAALPAYAFITDTPLGMRRVGAGIGALGAGGADILAWQAAGHIGVGATGRVYLDGTAMTGDTYIRESAANILTFRAGGADELDVYSNHLNILPTGYACVAEGDLSADSAQKSFEQWLGGQVSRISSVIPPLHADVTVHTTGGAYGAANVATVTVDTLFSVDGNTLVILAQGVARIRPSIAGGAATFTIMLRIEGTSVVQETFTINQHAVDSHWIAWEFRAEATYRASNAICVTFAKMVYSIWDQAGNPWPSNSDSIITAGAGDFISGTRESNIAVAGNVSVAIRAQIVNAQPADASYITVRQFNVGLQGAA